jgi:hypothetical protein
LVKRGREQRKLDARFLEGEGISRLNTTGPR